MKFIHRSIFIGNNCSWYLYLLVISSHGIRYKSNNSSILVRIFSLMHVIRISKRRYDIQKAHSHVINFTQSGKTGTNSLLKISFNFISSYLSCILFFFSISIFLFSSFENLTFDSIAIFYSKVFIIGPIMSTLSNQLQLFFFKRANDFIFRNG